MIFPDYDSTNFPVGLKNNLTTLLNDPQTGYTKEEFLQYHQFVLYTYMIKNPKIRGLLLFHDMGFGKSISAVALAEYYRKHDPDRNIIVLLSKSLQQNFKKNISKFLKDQIKADKSKTSGENLTDAQIDNIVDTKYKFVSLNASNMFTQMTRIDKTQDELLIEKQLQEFTDVVEKKDFLENSLLIIDEYHNLANSITNGSYNAIRLYDTIMNTKDIKLLFLSGTPIVNNPFELVPTFNMLRGPVTVDDKTTTVLFPELKKDFYMYFVDRKTNKIKNSDRFQNRILGMVSYYGDLYFGKKVKQDFPAELPTIVEKIHMSAEQFSRYKMARDLEQEEASYKGRPVRSERFSAKGDLTSSYRVKSRQISNYLIPEYALGPVRGDKARLKFIDKITNADLLKTQTFSPKFGKILHNINQHDGQLGLFYSEFVSGEGIGIFTRILEAHGYKSWNQNIKLKDEADSFGINLGADSENIISGGVKTKPKVRARSKSPPAKSPRAKSPPAKSPRAKSPLAKSPRTKSPQAKPQARAKSPERSPSLKLSKSSKAGKQFAIISGDVSIEDRTKIVSIFNSDENKHGAIISLLLISKTGAEGLDLKNIRHIHICEPYWNMARIEQIIARGVRYKSHIALSKSEQTVQPYIYLSDYPKDYVKQKNKKSKKLTEDTTDIDIYTVALKNKDLINQFLISLAEASIDCSIHEKNFSDATRKQIKCKLCSPNDKKLYHPILSKDLLLPNPCEEIKSESIKAKEIDINGEKYYYTKGESASQFHIFKYDKSVNGYIPMGDHESHYADIMRKILEY